MKEDKMGKKSNQDLVNFRAVSEQYLKEHPEKTKFQYALTRVEDILKPLIRKAEVRLSESSILNAATEKVGEQQVLLTDAKGNFRYEPEKLIKRNAEHVAIYEEEVEFEPYFATEIPDNLDPVYKTVFTGFVIREDEDNNAESEN
jgi:hypothetical protein